MLTLLSAYAKKLSLRDLVMTDMPSDQELTHLLQRWSEGNKDALEKLMPAVYEELHRVAKRYMSREDPAHTLQTTALVNEVYLRLIDWKNAKWQDRAHFFAVSATMMRRILVDHARSRREAKRAAARRICLDESLIVSDDYTEDLLALHEALERLGAQDARKVRVVELRFFAGLSQDETAEVLKVSRMTVARDWDFAKAWLIRELRSPKNAEEEADN
jgi:RNA polymerase sigma-70 factor (ECF subfamily)